LSKPQSKPAPTPNKRRRNSRGGAYWMLFGVCALLSFAGGFWYTYQVTSQVSVKDPGANDAPMATPLPNQALVTPGPDTPVEEPAPVGIAASDLGQDPSPAPTATPKPAQAAQPATDVAKAAGAGAQGVYRVQVGSYSSREEAQAMVEELAVAGIDAMVVEDEGKFHAQIGAYGSRQRALAVADDVNTKGYSVTIRH